MSEDLTRTVKCDVEGCQTYGHLCDMLQQGSQNFCSLKCLYLYEVTHDEALQKRIGKAFIDKMHYLEIYINRENYQRVIETITEKYGRK